MTDLVVVEDGCISENILLGKDALCRDGSRFVIEDSECWIENTTT